jgi:hypothetical protein
MTNRNHISLLAHLEHCFTYLFPHGVLPLSVRLPPDITNIGSNYAYLEYLPDHEQRHWRPIPGNPKLQEETGWHQAASSATQSVSTMCGGRLAGRAWDLD